MLRGQNLSTVSYLTAPEEINMFPVSCQRMLDQQPPHTEMVPLPLRTPIHSLRSPAALHVVLVVILTV